jgi:hypothetical protein
MAGIRVLGQDRFGLRRQRIEAPPHVRQAWKPERETSSASQSQLTGQM